MTCSVFFSSPPAIPYEYKWHVYPSLYMQYMCNTGTLLNYKYKNRATHRHACKSFNSRCQKLKGLKRVTERNSKS